MGEIGQNDRKMSKMCGNVQIYAPSTVLTPNSVKMANSDASFSERTYLKAQSNTKAVYPSII